MPTHTYRDLKTKRALSYHYLFVSPQPGKPTIIFIHGFPSTHRDWRHQISYFATKGYGVIAPDMLGYGGTDKPTDVKYYAWKDISADIIDIVDAESVDKVFVVGHDWGCAIVSRLAVLPSDRFLGFAFLNVGFMDHPVGDFKLDEYMAKMKAISGNERIGYWKFLIRDDAASFLEENIDSFLSVAHPDDPGLWKTVMNNPGALEDWVRKGNRTERPKYLSEEDYSVLRDEFLKNGLTAPLNWYKAMVAGLNCVDKKEESMIVKPVFYGAALRDYVSLAVIMKNSAPKATTDLTIVDFDTGHWPQLEATDILNTTLETWMESK